MYHRHFGLDGSPFSFSPSASELYMSRAHREGLAALRWGILHEPSGFTLLIGETGTGKTTLLKAVLARNYARVKVASLSNPRLGFDGMLREIIRQFRLTAAPRKFEMFDALDRFLERLSGDERAVIVVDEAQSCDDSTLEELRLFSNRGASEQKQLHFVLAAQPELADRLLQPALRQLNDRIGARAILPPLSAPEARGYLEFRLNLRGGTVSQVFEPKAAGLILERSAGIPRRINVLAHNAMLLAYATGTSRVDAQAARRAIAQYDDPLAAERRRSVWAGELTARTFRRGVALLAAVVAVLGLIGIIAALGSGKGRNGTDFADQLALKPLRLRPRLAATQPSGAVLPSPVMLHASLGADRHDSLNPAAQTTGGDETAAGNSHPRRIRVHHGDTLEHIAVRYLGSQQALKSLIDANPQLSNVDLIYPGQIVYLPADAAAQE